MNPQSKKINAVKQSDDDRKALDKKWEALNNKCKQANPGYIPPDIPFKPDNLIRDFNSLYAKIYDKERYIQA